MATQLSLNLNIFGLKLEPTTIWVMAPRGLDTARDVVLELLTGPAPLAVSTFLVIAKRGFNLPLSDSTPDDLLRAVADAVDGLRENRLRIKELCEAAGVLLVVCDRDGRPAIKSGGKAEGFALMASETGMVHTRQHVTMALASAVADIRSHRAAGMINGDQEAAALLHVDELKQLLLPAMTEPAPVEG